VKIELFTERRRSSLTSEIINGFIAKPKMQGQKLKRQIQAFRHKIQQAVAVKDDEIGRMMQQLILYKTEITESRIRLHRLHRSVEAAKHRMQGGRKYGEATLKECIARKEVNYTESILQLQASQTAEIDGIQKQFAEMLTRLNESNQTDEIARMKSVEDQIVQLKAEIASCQESIAEAMSDQSEGPESSSLVAECELIADLQTKVRVRTAERLEGLKHSKTRLTECLQLLEDMESTHETNVAEYHQKLDDIDACYQLELQRLTESGTEEKAGQKARLDKARRNLAALERALQKLQSGQKENLKVIASSYSAVHPQFSSSAPMESEEARKVQKRRLAMKGLNRILAVREKALDECRLTNDSLRRELEGVKHEIRFAERFRRFRDGASERLC
jgi:hypothetical protein